MAEVNFYLKDSKSSVETPINLCFQYDRNRFKFSAGEKILPKFWNSKDQRVKKSFRGSTELNSVLDKVGEEVKKIYRDAVTDGVSISNEYLRTAIKKRLNKDQGKRKSFYDYFDEFLEVNRATKKPNTLKKFISLLNHLHAFEQKSKTKLAFDRIDIRFYEQFTAFLISDQQHLNNTVGKYIAALKTFLHWATAREYNKYTSFLKFKTPNEDAGIIYLSEEELENLYSFDLKGNARLEQVRDLFCFGCFTGLRFSDIVRLRKENVKGDEIHFKTKKTKDNLAVPLNVFALEILEKYNYSFPAISNQKTNQYLKELGELVGINEATIITKYSGSTEIQFKEPKYKFISSHTARRTFVTLSLEKGMRAEIVMSITGHKDYKTFKKYINITNKVKAIEMHKIWKRESKLSVVV